MPWALHSVPDTRQGLLMRKGKLERFVQEKAGSNLKLGEDGLGQIRSTRATYTHGEGYKNWPQGVNLEWINSPQKSPMESRCIEIGHRFPESKLARMFNGSIPIVLDTLKQHYFIDRDGPLFRYILNYLRTQRLVVPTEFDQFEQLYEEARYYELAGLLKDLENIKKAKDISKVVKEIKTERVPTQEFVDCIAVSISPDLGERICLSSERPLIEEIFPELATALMDTRNSGWHLDNHYVIRFPLNGFCKLNSIQVTQRLFNHSFVIAASTGGGVEGQQFSEYLFTRNCKTLH